MVGKHGLVQVSHESARVERAGDDDVAVVSCEDVRDEDVSLVPTPSYRYSE